jgi:hypothetical protein
MTSAMARPRRSAGVIATAALDAVAVMVAAPAAVMIRASNAST